MAMTREVAVPIDHADRFFIGGEWVAPSTSSMFDVIDSGTEELFVRVAEAQAPDVDRAVGAARQAFDDGPWPRLSHEERAGYLRAIGEGLAARPATSARSGRAQSGVLHKVAQYSGVGRRRDVRHVRGFADTFAVRGAGDADPRRGVRPARAGAGRGGRRDHPVERAGVADLAQDRAGAPRGLHGGAEGRRRRRRARRTSSPRSPSRSGCRRACSTS